MTGAETSGARVSVALSATELVKHLGSNVAVGTTLDKESQSTATLAGATALPKISRESDFDASLSVM